MIFDILKIAFQQEQHLQNKIRVLQIGPDNKMVEMIIKRQCLSKGHLLGYKPSNSAKILCNECPIRLICTYYQYLKKDEIKGFSCRFDKVILLADSPFATEKGLFKLKKVLKSKGNIIMFLEEKQNTINKFCFHSKDVLQMINKTGLEIEYIREINVSKKKRAFCLSACK